MLFDKSIEEFITKDLCLKNFSLKFKLITLSIFLVAISATVGGVAYFSINKVISDFSEISDVSFPNTTSLLQMSGNLRIMRIEALNIVSTTADAQAKKEAVEIIESNLKSYAELNQKYLAVPFEDGEEVLYNRFNKSAEMMIKDFNSILNMHKKNDQSLMPEMIDIVYKKIPMDAKENRGALHDLRTFHFNMAEKNELNARETERFANWLIIILGSSLSCIGLVFSYFFSTSLAKSLQQIGQTLDNASAQVSAAAGQIASSSEELSQATTEQAAALQETSSSVEEMSSMVNINFENSKRASESSLVSKKQAEKGRMVVDEMVNSMNLIDESNTKIMEQINVSNEKMAEIVKVIQEIGTKTKVINDIVFQTKLLSFNASVEAARAGEQGKGFAVVAEEVGNLAQMSGNAAKEISDMLAASVDKVESIASETKVKVDAMIADGREKIKAGSRVAEECGEVLSEIVTNVTSVSTMATEISNASDEQSKGIQEITKAMGQLDQVTQANAATSQECASAAEELSAQAVSLKNQVTSLVSVINGTGAKASASDYHNHSQPTKKQYDSNVVPMRKPAAKKPMSAPVAKASAPMPEMKKAVGMGTKDSVPNCDHPGFEEV
jgi:methyl-accepting chemotaxis protein